MNGSQHKKLTHARRKAERTAQKAEQAQNRLPARKKLRMETVSDPETGKAKKHLKFEKEVKSQKVHVKGPVPLRPVKAGANTAIGYAHKKIYEAEDENVGIKAAHRSELVGEAGLRTAYHRHKTAPYRKAAKLQQKSAKANARLAYRQALSDHPELKKHAIARIWQKQKLKRQYAKAAREAGKQAKNAAVATERVSVGIVHAVKRHPVTETERMSRLITTLLDLSALENGATQLRPERFDFVDFLETVAGRLLIDTPDADFVLEYELPEHPVYVNTDKGRMEQVLNNLIVNAKRNNRPGGILRLSLLEKDGLLNFSIFNQGAPIPEESLSKIWSKFYRDKNSKYSGSGLGLAIVAQVLSMQHLHYGAENQPGGVAFYFSLPTVK